MLRELEVRNLGIIDALRVQFPAGFVVLTGETGAGKSLLVQSLQLLAGERADSDQVRQGSERLLVEGCFVWPPASAMDELLAELGVPRAEELVLRREVSSQGRSRAWIGDVPVTISALQKLAPFLLSIHGQHEQRGLMDAGNHLAIIDAAGGLLELRAEVTGAFAAWTAVRERLEAQRRALATRRDRLDVIAFQLREIEEVRVAAGEDVELREERTLLRHAGRIGELLVVSRGALSGDAGSVALARAGRAVRELSTLGLEVAAVADQLDEARVLAEDVERELEALAERVRVDPQRLEVVEGRLAALERLAHKYGGSLAGVIEHRERLAVELAALERVEEDLAGFEAEERARAEAYLEVADRLSGERRKASESFAREVVAVLEKLGMPKVRLRLALEPRSGAGQALEVAGRTAVASAGGVDDGELLLSPNPGEEPRALVRIASGGELSRVHLAIRTVLRDVDKPRQALTLLFDEVDAGIGGHVADELGALLADLGRRDQVVVVTHLPQVAGRADSHFAVRKQLVRGRAVTRVVEVEGEGRVEELVRMLGGGPDKPAARQHARELLRGA
jgi:DNA repair protein RecN (Recombination protein N)